MTASALIIGSDGLARPAWAATTDLLRHYYDTEWGMPVRDEQGLFERLSLEAFQAGLSWELVLRKREGFRAAFAGFAGSFSAGALFAGAVTRNARAGLELREDGGLVDRIWSHQPAENLAPETRADIPSRSPESEALSKALKKAGLTFLPPVMCFALMEAIGMVDTHLLGSHRRGTSGVWGEA